MSKLAVDISYPGYRNRLLRYRMGLPDKQAKNSAVLRLGARAAAYYAHDIYMQHPQPAIAYLTTITCVVM